MRYPLVVIQTALVNASQECRYHGQNWGFLGFESGNPTAEPRCESCKQPWRVVRALEAVDKLARESIKEPSP